MSLFWRLLLQSHRQSSVGRSQGLEGPHATHSLQGCEAAPVLAGASRGFWKQLLELPGLLQVMAPSLPKYSSSLAPFKCTPLADDSMRKCRTRSLLSLPGSRIEDSVSTSTIAVVSPLPSPARPVAPSQGIHRRFCSAVVPSLDGASPHAWGWACTDATASVAHTTRVLWLLSLL